MSEPLTPRLELPMICTCSDDGRVAAEALVFEVMHRLSMGGPELAPRDISPTDLVTEVIRSLNWDVENRVRIESIDCDQWFLIRAVALDGTVVLIQADRAEDGLAAIWKHFADAQELAMDAEEPIPG